MQIIEFDHIEMCVQDILEATQLYSTRFGLQPIAEAGPETGLAGRRSVVLAQGRAQLVLTSALGSEGPIAEYVSLHGDGVRDVALLVDDAAAAYHEAVARGARPVLEPTVWKDGRSRVVKATIAAFGDVVHSFIQRDGVPDAPFMSHYRPIGGPRSTRDDRFAAMDHMAICLPTGALDATVAFYREILDFTITHQEKLCIGATGMNSAAVQHGDVRLVMQEPIAGREGGQIAEFLSCHGGPGIQHVALLTDSILESLEWLQERDISFLETPSAYYDMLSERVGTIDEDLALLRQLGVLVDKDEWGYLLQVFTRSLHEKQTLFFELIQRKAARGFGSANIRALFEAVELESERNGPRSHTRLKGGHPAQSANSRTIPPLNMSTPCDLSA